MVVTILLMSKTSEREDGQLLILPSVQLEEGGAPSARTLGLSCGCKDNEKTDMLQLFFICKPCKDKRVCVIGDFFYLCII